MAIHNALQLRAGQSGKRTEWRLLQRIGECNPDQVGDTLGGERYAASAAKHKSRVAVTARAERGKQRSLVQKAKRVHQRLRLLAEVFANPLPIGAANKGERKGFRSVGAVK